ncbi:MAG: hypothetical protein II998_05050 [Clostridia bacterium]|nr:hypothetical protein [Clostridia bacterium]
MKRLICLIVTLVFIISFTSCSDSTENNKDKNTDYYITVNDEILSKEYISYFFYLAQESMLSEAGWTNDNSTQADIQTYWETTEIDGKSAIDVARDAAAINAVEQKVKYFKALLEGITLSDDILEQIENEILSVIEQNGGEAVFEETLNSMGTDIESYRQIVIENTYIQLLYDSYVSNGIITLTDDELSEFTEKNFNKYNENEMHEAALMNKFNNMAKEWEKEFEIFINDDSMNEFDIIYDNYK